jgi:hypothetical protein
VLLLLLLPLRPDVMARYTTRIEADASKYPVLLSNGNLKEEGQLEGGRHYAVWEVRALLCGSDAKHQKVAAICGTMCCVEHIRGACACVGLTQCPTCCSWVLLADYQAS